MACIFSGAGISTIIDSDLVLVMGDGKVVESGPPAELLAKPGGVFAAMAAASGNQTRKGQ